MRRLALFTALLWLPAGPVLALGGECHIHAPDDYPSFGRKPLVIPSVGDRDACERLNAERFGGAGRCHCSGGPGGNLQAPTPSPPIPSGPGADPLL